MRQYEQLYLALGDLNEAKKRVVELEQKIQHMMVGCIPDAEHVAAKRVSVRRKKTGKWSAYKRNKFALKCKERWAKMSAEERSSRVHRMLMARRTNRKG